MIQFELSFFPFTTRLEFIMKNLFLIEIFGLLIYFLDKASALQCFNCTNCEDFDITNKDLLRNCPSNTNYCYIIVNENGEWSRNCLEQKTTFSEHSIIITCQNDLCNSNTTTLKCYSCRGENCNRDLSRQLKSCQLDENFCYARISNDGHSFEKGCSSVPVCSDLNTCRECQTNGCNKYNDELATIQDEVKAIHTNFLHGSHKRDINQECISCQGNEASTCFLKPETLAPKSCTNVGDGKMGCFTQRYEHLVERGCLSEQNPEIINECLSTNDEGCTSCQGKVCNIDAVNKLECYTCSSADTSNCFHLKNSEKTKICDSVLDTCITGVTPNGKDTIRGCKNEVSYGLLNTYATCISNRCNNITLFKDVAKCHVCGDNNNVDYACNSLPSNNALKACRNSSDACYAYLNRNGGMVRGCSSDKNFENCKPENCIISDSPGDNWYSFNNTISCFQCTSNDPFCPWSQDSGTHITSCVFAFPKIPQCFTKINGTSISRGCANEVMPCKFGEQGCKLCNTSQCNNEATKLQSCIQCDTAHNNENSCEHNAQSIKPIICKPADYGQRGCYTARNNKVVSRGCAVSLTLNDLAKCESSDKKCEICEADGCNYKEAPNGSISYTKLTKFSTIYLGLLILSTFI